MYSPFLSGWSGRVITRSLLLSLVLTSGAGLGSLFDLPVGIPTASATVLAELSVDQMTDGADAIVRGTVISQWVMLNPAGHVVTRALVQVERVWKGQVVAGEVIAVDSPGGDYMGLMADVASAARFSDGEAVFLFLSSVYNGQGWTPVGMFQGKYSIRQNPVDGSEMPVRFTVSYEREFDARFIPHPAPVDRISMEKLGAPVEQRLQNGWDGKPIPGISPERLRQINRLAPGVR